MRLRTAFTLLGPFVRSLADAFRPMWNMCVPCVRTGAGGATAGSENGRAAALLLRIAERFGLRWRCRRRAYILARAYARDGRRASIRFGMRPAGPDEDAAGGLAGHVWVEPDGRGTAADGYRFVVTPYDDAANSEWRRG